MPKTLILVRHGKAQRGSITLPDEERELTPEGIAALAADTGFARAFSLLSDEERASARIWASPARRTLQTARLVADAIGGREIEAHPCLWEQDSHTFLTELRESDAACVIAVGHIPFADEAVAYLTGAALGFKPGGVAAIELDQSLANGESSLLWFVQGPVA